MSFHLILKIDANTESSRSGILNRKATGRLSTQIPIGKSFYLGELSKKLPLLGENVIYINQGQIPGMKVPSVLVSFRGVGKKGVGCGV